MESFIDKSKNIVYTDAQISKRLKALEEKRFSEWNERVLNRIQWGAILGVRELTEEEQYNIAQFQQYMAELEQLSATVRADNEFVKQRIAYENAVARLNQYVLSEGREATYQYFDIETDENITDESPLLYDPNESPQTVRRVTIQEAIEPLPQEIPEDPDSSPIIIIPNPAIIQDKEERTAAQAIIDVTPQEVKDFVSNSGV
jgi:hypothetical protein